MMFNRFDIGNDGTLGMYTPPEIAGSSSMPRNPIDWNGVINQGFALASQAFNSFGGQTVGTQFATNRTQGGIFALQPTANQGGGGYQPTYTPEQLAAMQGGGVGGTIGGGVDGIFNWLMSNPLITFGGIAAIYLLMKEPPRSRR